ncbi:sensor histidine kinase [Actinoplanes italicus]|nr:HAMP domain-containing sensor histidine kinase [Actinoplanes italicus]
MAGPGRRLARSRPGARRFPYSLSGGGLRSRRCRWARPPAASEHESELRALMVMASHDLKNPLATITAHIEMLRADYADTLGEAFGRDLAAIERGLHRLTTLTQDLLTYAKADHTLSLATVSLSGMVDDVIADHAVTASTPPEITVTGTLPDVPADAALLRHVLDNLVGNAVKYTRPGTAARIEISARVRTNGSVLVEVADRGIGIPAADRSQVFDSFRRCANSTGYPGTGLGLAICKRIIERHGGRIGVDENPGGGSRFWFTVPTGPAGSGKPDIVTAIHATAPDSAP